MPLAISKTKTMNKIQAYKMDGLGNDFIIIDRRKKSTILSKKQIIKKQTRPKEVINSSKFN